MSYVVDGQLVGPVLLGGPAGETDVRSMAGVTGRPSGRDGCTVDGRCYWEAQRERRMHGRWLGAVEYAEKRFAELSVVDEVDNDIVGRAEDGQRQLHQDEPTGPFGTVGLAGQFLQEQNRYVFD